MNNQIGGENNPKAKLTQRRVQILREYYELHHRPRGAPRHPSFVTVQEISRKIHMAISSVRSMLRGQTWGSTDRR